MATIRELVKHNLEIQKQLNDFIKPDWMDILDEFDFYIATKQEISELIDCFPWKWWTKQEVDVDNAKIELVDIWHFMLSIAMLTNDEEFLPIISDSVVEYYLGEYDIRNTQIMLDRINHLDEVLKKKLYSFKHDVLQEFFSLVNTIFDTKLSEFFQLYYLKVTLNVIRQKEGYKTGEYQKVIDNIEDNRQLLNMIDDINLDKVIDMDLDRLIEYVALRR